MKIVFFSAALLASSLATAAVPIDGWYASIFGGYAYLPDNVSNGNDGFNRTRPSYDSGYNGGGRLGFQSNPLRYELEVTYINANLKKFLINNISPLGVEGESTATLGMANVYFDFPEMVPCISPFLGVGLGYGYVTAQLNSRAAFLRTNLKVSDSVFAYQATAGLTYNFAENYAVNLAYRYVGTERADELGKVFQANLATLGVVYRFDGYNYK